MAVHQANFNKFLVGRVAPALILFRLPRLRRGLEAT
jgi:hypothetical protein